MKNFEQKFRVKILEVQDGGCWFRYHYFNSENEALLFHKNFRNKDKNLKRKSLYLEYFAKNSWVRSAK